MKTVLFVVPSLSGGGAERVVSTWASGLARLGQTAHVLVFYRADDEYGLDGAVHFHSVSRSKQEYDSLTIWRKISAVRRVLKAIRLDVVIPFLPHVGLMVSAARLGLPVKMIETIRNNPRTSPESRLFRWLRNVSVLLSRRCIVQTKAQLDYFPRRLRGRMAVLANPVPEEFCGTEKAYEGRGILRIAAAGRLVEQKDYPTLIRAFSGVVKKHGDVALDIYGDGPLYTELDTMIWQTGLRGQAHLRGRCVDMADIYRSSDLFVLSSAWEGMPNSLMEAMAAGLPCVSTDCPTGPAELIDDGVNGLLVPVGDADALEKAIGRMIANAGEAIEMGRRARESILSSHTAAASSQTLMRFIESV